MSSRLAVEKTKKGKRGHGWPRILNKLVLWTPCPKLSLNSVFLSLYILKQTEKMKQEREATLPFSSKFKRKFHKDVHHIARAAFLQVLMKL